MQVYKGLDILTNKATAEEMRGVPHHMISVVDRKEKFDVVHFRDQALPLVSSSMDIIIFLLQSSIKTIVYSQLGCFYI